jgi:uncharacterized membrane protein
MKEPDWVEEALKRVENMSREELISLLDKHNIKWQDKKKLNVFQSIALYIILLVVLFFIGTFLL